MSVRTEAPPPGRPLSGLERVWLAADRMAPPFVNQCVLTHLPALDAERLGQAVERAGFAHPGTRVRLAGRLRATRWVVDGPGPRFTVLEGTTWLARSEAGAPFLAAALSPLRGPVCEVLWLPSNTPETRHLIIRTHHAALDGRGTQLFIEDLLGLYDGKPPLGAEAGPTFDLEMVRATGAGGPHLQARLEPAADAIAPTGAAGPSTQHTWRRVTLPPPLGPVLPRVLRALVNAIEDLAVGASAEHEPLRIGLPVDLRRYVPELRSSANLTGVAPLELPRPAPELAALTAAIEAAARGPAAPGHVLAGDRLRGTPLWLMTLAGRLAAPSLRKRGRYPISASVSNLGRHAWQIAGTPLRAFWVPPPSPGLPLFLSLCGTRDALELCAGAPAGLADGGRLDALLTALIKHLA